MGINDYDVIADLYDLYVPATYDIDFFIWGTAGCKGEVLELMSGSGRVSLPLVKAGVRLTCVDISTELNAIFQKKLTEAGLSADIYQMDICELDLPKRFEKIIIPFHSFAHIVSKDDQRRALQRIYAHLQPGGMFICTLGNPAVRGKSIDGQLRLFRKYADPATGGNLFLWVLETRTPIDPEVIQALQFFEEYNSKGVMTSRRLLELHFRLTSKEKFEQLARETGFSIQAFYGDFEKKQYVEESSPSMVWVLQK